MPRWTRNESLDTLPRAKDYVTPGGFRVPASLLLHLLVELSQRHGVATLTQLLRRVGVPKGAGPTERARAMRLLTAPEVLVVTDWVVRRIGNQRRRQGSRRIRAESPLDRPCESATWGADVGA